MSFLFSWLLTVTVCLDLSDCIIFRVREKHVKGVHWINFGTNDLGCLVVGCVGLFDILHILSVLGDLHWLTR